MISQRWTPHDEAFVLVTIVDECIGPLVLIQRNGTPAVANFEKGLFIRSFSPRSRLFI